jgi:hypothetical protein
MENYSELIRLVWIATGVLSFSLLSQNPDKLVFDGNFWGQMKKMSIFVLLGFGGPITFIIYFILPRKKLCKNCGKTNPKDTATCKHCGYSFQEQTDKQIEELIQAPWTKYSKEVQAVIKEGQKRINLPIPFVMIAVWVLGGIISFTLNNGFLMMTTVVVGFISGWLWWSFSVPRWREWALKQPGVTEDELQVAAELALLVWPKGNIFEKTEIKTKK